MLRVAAAIFASVLLFFALADIFFTVVLARRSQWAFRLTRAFYTATWTPYSTIAKRIQSGRRRENYLSIYGPLSLLTLLVFWMVSVIIAFGLLHWAARLQTENGSGLTYSLYFSGAGLFTAVAAEPLNTASKFLMVVESGLGICLLGLVVGYLPVFYQSFSSRELRILKLDARAGSPPSAIQLLKRQPANPEILSSELDDWEDWEAEFLQTHVAYPMLAYFRSQHANQSWLGTMVSIVDASAVLMICSDGDLRWRAELAFKMGRHAMVDLARVFRVDPHRPENPRLPPDNFAKVREAIASVPIHLNAERLNVSELDKLLSSYEPYANALSEYFLVALPAWIQTEPSPDNWILTDQRDSAPKSAVSDPFREGADETEEGKP